MVIVGDDCALAPRGVAGRRGLAGTILVHKVYSQFLLIDLCLEITSRRVLMHLIGHLFLHG